MRSCVIVLLSCVVATAADPATPPAAHGPTPTERQLRWHEMEFYGFLHFTVNTFTDKEWGYGDESGRSSIPRTSMPTRSLRTAKDAGMKGLILTGQAP